MLARKSSNLLAGASFLVSTVSFLAAGQEQRCEECWAGIFHEGGHPRSQGPPVREISGGGRNGCLASKPCVIRKRYSKKILTGGPCQSRLRISAPARISSQKLARK